MSDIEILFVPKTVRVPDISDLFGRTTEASAVDLALDVLLKCGVIAKRPNINGSFTWGPENKLASHVFVRTGPSALNINVASRAKSRGWEMHAYGDGFTRGTREHKKVKSEYDVFNHVELPYQEPWER